MVTSMLILARMLRTLYYWGRLSTLLVHVGSSCVAEPGQSSYLTFDLLKPFSLDMNR